MILAVVFCCCRTRHEWLNQLEEQMNDARNKLQMRSSSVLTHPSGRPHTGYQVTSVRVNPSALVGKIRVNGKFQLSARRVVDQGTVFSFQFFLDAVVLTPLDVLFFSFSVLRLVQTMHPRNCTTCLRKIQTNCTTASPTQFRTLVEERQKFPIHWYLRSTKFNCKAQ